MQAHDALGETLCYQGALRAARHHLEQYLALVAPPSPDATQGESLYRRVLGRVFLAKSLWLLRYPQQALARLQEAQTLAQQSATLTDLALTLDFMAGLHQLRGDVQAVQDTTAALLRLARAHGLPPAWCRNARRLRAARPRARVTRRRSVEQGIQSRGSPARTGYPSGRPGPRPCRDGPGCGNSRTRTGLRRCGKGSPPVGRSGWPWMAPGSWA